MTNDQFVYKRPDKETTMLYTAVTRSPERLVIMVDEILIDAALARGNVAINRAVNITL